MTALSVRGPLKFKVLNGFVTKKAAEVIFFKS